MKISKSLIISYIFYIIAGFSISLSIKANVGISSFNAMNMALSSLLQVKVGYILAAINLIFLLIYMIMSKFKEKRKYFLQLLSALLFGSVINFFNYNILGSLVVSSYLLRIILILISIICGGLSIGVIVSYGVITFPIESVCMALANRSSLSFAHYRYGIDIISISISLIISLNFDILFYIREGTIISLILFSGMINFTKDNFSRLINAKT